MKLRNITTLGLLFVLLCLMSCTSEPKKYLIGVSQCSEDSWRSKLEAELEQSTYFNPNVELVMCSADDDMEQQSRQIDSLVDLNVDLLIVSPQQVSKLSKAIQHATEAKIPVILFDRKSDAKNYTAFMGADNYAIGKMLGEYAATQLHGVGNIVEIGGEHGSSPAIERRKGFDEAIAKYPGMKIIAFKEGDWKEPSGEKAMNEILSELPSGTKIDCVFGGNDRMAVGAHKAMNIYQQTHTSAPACWLSQSVATERTLNSTLSTIYLGIDALPTTGGGIEQVRDGLLTVSAIYPTHGDKLMELALAILNGEPYEKQTNMETSLVTKDNANVLLLQHKEVDSQHQYIKKMHARVDSIIGQMNTERVMLFVIILVAAVLAISFVVTMKTLTAKHRLIAELEAKNEALNAEKEKVESQREELEEKEDQLLDATEPAQADETLHQTQTEIEESVRRDPAPVNDIANNTFLRQFMESLDKRIADSDLSVEDIGKDLYMSRVNLYRKVKTMTGKTPVEIIREERLKRAHILLQDASLTVSEVAYKVGFSAPSYFAKCYKAFYGKAPSEQ